MKYFLAAILFCGISTVYSDTMRAQRAMYRPYSDHQHGVQLNRSSGVSGVSDVSGDPRPGGRSFITVPEADVADRSVNAKHNYRLVKVLENVQNNLAFTDEDSNPENKKRLFSYNMFFLLNYFEADYGIFTFDFTEALAKTKRAFVNDVPAHLVAAPVRTVFSKFIFAVSRRIGAVQEVCPNRDLETRVFLCKERVAEKDQQAANHCPFYELNVKLHNCALNNVASMERVLEIISQTKSVANEAELSQSLKFLRAYQSDLEPLKSLYRLLKRHIYVCSDVKTFVVQLHDATNVVRADSYDG